MNPRYERNIPALTEAECDILRGMRVLVVGCGGLGGYLIDMLARMGIGSVRVVDGDVFEPTNLNRQLLSEVPLLGVSKAKAAAARISRVNPDVNVEAVDAFLTEANVRRLLLFCDAVLDGLDNIESRRLLAKECARAGIPYIYGAVNGWVAQAAISMPGDHLVETLYPEGAALKNKSVLSFTPALCASMQVSLCVKLLVGRPVETGTLYYFDLLSQEFETIPMV
ncbi:MAG: HesA/MoeB/ThiF family protein [Faecousia sp.]